MLMIWKKEQAAKWQELLRGQKRGEKCQRQKANNNIWGGNAVQNELPEESLL